MDERATNLLTAHHEKLLYLVVGSWNTLFQYGVFSLCWSFLRAKTPQEWVPIGLASYDLRRVA